MDHVGLMEQQKLSMIENVLLEKLKCYSQLLTQQVAVISSNVSQWDVMEVKSYHLGTGLKAKV